MHSIKPIIFLILATLFYSSWASAGSLSKNDAINLAQQQHAGRVLSVKLKGARYQVKIISPAGKVRVININVNSER